MSHSVKSIAGQTRRWGPTGLDPVPRPRDRLFFSLFPDAAAAARLAALAGELRSRHGLTGRPHAMDRFHVTLHHLGDHAGLPNPLVTAALQAAAALVQPPFKISFDHCRSFSGRSGKRPLVLLGPQGVTALGTFQQALGVQLKKVGLGDCALAEDYTPHITLLRDARSVADQPIDPLGWVAHEFVLVHSLLGQSRYLPLGRWTLRA